MDPARGNRPESRKREVEVIPDSPKFHYIKSATCADIPVHGAFGGINPVTGQVVMSVFSERSPIPKSIVYEAGPDGEQGEHREGLDGMVRSVNAVMYFDINVAMALHQWLGQKIDVFREQHPELFEDEK